LASLVRRMGKVMTDFQKDRKNLNPC